ncbi:hypothetical protein NDU88_000681 [Pleurodeles waltl]|uniref:Uncharacterized protein n=1 Tax=Pleurodeles waltl TaxID=8319 RepID=A0AAV7VXM3_PLEWA|nr:hypothetical protein NDU88_000681 [Pleurodeles waltl]
MLLPKQAELTQGSQTSPPMLDKDARPGVLSLKEHTNRILAAIHNKKVALEQKIETVAQDVCLLRADHRTLGAKVEEAKCAMTDMAPLVNDHAARIQQMQ